MIWILPAILIASIIETTVFQYPFTLILIAMLALAVDEQSHVWPFLGGLFLDVISFRPLGSSSLFFLIISWIVKRYKMKIHFANYLYVFVILLIMVSLYDYLFNRILLSITHILITIILGIILLVIMPKIFPEKIGSRQKLVV